MDQITRDIAASCLKAAESDALTFPAIVETLQRDGFESYLIDLRTSRATYYRASGDSLDLPTHRVDAAVAAAFDVEALRGAIREAQMQTPSYSYKGFCRKAALAGVAGYIVSFRGRRAVYFGRTAETHVELFP